MAVLNITSSTVGVEFTFAEKGHRTAVAVIADTTAIRLLLQGHRYDELIPSHADAAAWAAALGPAQP